MSTFGSRPGAGSEPWMFQSIAIAASALLHVGILAWGLNSASAPLRTPPPSRDEVLMRLQLQPPAAPVQPPAPTPGEPSPELQKLGPPKPSARIVAPLSPVQRERPYQLAASEKPQREPSPEPEPQAATSTQPEEALLDTDSETSQAASNALALPPAEQARGRTHDSWQARVLAHLQKHRRYPRQARALRQQGVVSMQATVNRQGQVSALQLEQGSGHALLDQAALATVQRAQPLPAVPESLPDVVRVQLQVAFTL